MRLYLFTLLLLSTSLARAGCTSLANYSCAEPGPDTLCIVIGAPAKAECETLQEAVSYCESHKNHPPTAVEQCVVRGGEGTQSVILNVTSPQSAYDSLYIWVGSTEPGTTPAETEPLDCGQPPTCAGSDPAFCALAHETHETRCAVTGRDQVVEGVDDCEQPLVCTASPVDCAHLQATKTLRCTGEASNEEQRQALQQINAYLASGVAADQRLAALYQLKTQELIDALAPLSGCDEPPCQSQDVVAAIDQLGDDFAFQLDGLRDQVGALNQSGEARSERLRQDLANALDSSGLPTADPDGQASDGWATPGTFAGFDTSGLGFSRSCPFPAFSLGGGWSAGFVSQWCGLANALSLLFLALSLLWSLSIVLDD